MSIHLDSPCKQCHYFKKCSDDRKINRKEKQNKWIDNNKIIGMSKTDCFISPEQHKKDFDNLPRSKKEALIKCQNLSCWGNYDGSINQCANHCKCWKECSKETYITEF